MDFTKYILEEVLYFIPVLNVIGLGLKSLKAKWLPTQVIPFVLGGLSIAGAIALLGFNLNAIMQGILCAGAAVYANQLWKQGSELINKE